MFKNLHPTETASLGGRLKDRKLIAPDERSETHKWECPHCGAINDDETHDPTNEEGEGTRVITVTVNVPGGTKNFKEPIRVSGCYVCRKNYKKSSYGKPLFKRASLLGR